ncbi:hypothetical protein [Paenibacillus sp. HB172176]|uniref:rhamnogalacturonan lyase family protein n=1 Tax=Paenibacillus sp. HB172176 TaxID=2493690 RepID=UPI00143C9F85|nr:hypothetical protein [Paenibacillus sp. HB172176]
MLSCSSVNAIIILVEHDAFDAATGEVLFGGFVTEDVGRGMTEQVDPDYRGMQVWPSEDVKGPVSFGLMTARGELIDAKAPSTNMNIKWAANMTTQIISGTFDSPVAITSG